MCLRDVRSNSLATSSPALISMRRAVGAVNQTLTLNRSIREYQVRGVEAALKGDDRASEVPRPEYAHGRACHPPRVGRAPEDVILAKVRHILRAGELLQHGPMREHDPLGLAGGTGGVMDYVGLVRLMLTVTKSGDPDPMSCGYGTAFAGHPSPTQTTRGAGEASLSTLDILS